MSKGIILLHCAFLPFLAFSQNNFNLQLLAHWDDPSLPVNPALGLKYNSCWGLTVHNHEYAVIGGAAHVLFLDVTNPQQPRLAGKFQGRATVVPREFKSYKNRVYAVADGFNDGLMIFDLSHAEDTIVRTYWDTTLFKKIHTIAIDTSSGRIYLNGGNANQGIIVLDASQNPDNPVFLSHVNLPGGAVHDCYVRHDTVYASSGSDGYYIFDYRNPQTPVLLAQISTGGYNHNSWVTLDGKYAYYTEETFGQPIHIVDLQNLALGEIEVVGSFLDNLQAPDDSVKLAIAHNVYIKGDLLFDSQYEDGLLVYDISDRIHPVLIAHYDTYPENTTYNGFFGNWGNYPWLPSGAIVASDMQHGLFLFRLNYPAVNTREPEPAIALYPNPANETVLVRMETGAMKRWNLLNTNGECILQGDAGNGTAARINLAGLPAGLYFVEINTSDGGRILRKLAVSH